MAETISIVLPPTNETSAINCNLFENTGELFCKECPSALGKPWQDESNKLLSLLTNQEELNEKERERQKLTGENYALKQRISDLETRLNNQEELNEKERERQKLTEENDALKLRIRELENSLTNQEEALEKQRRIETLTEEYNALQQHLSELNTINRTKDNAHESELRIQKEDLEQKIRGLEEQVEEFENRLSGTTEKHQQVVRRLTQELDNTQVVSCKKRDFKLDLQNHRISIVEQSLESKIKEIVDNEQKMKKVDIMKETLETKTENYENTILTANKKIETYKKEIEKYQKPIECSYLCTSCSSYIEKRSFPQGQAPLPEVVEFNKSFRYIGVES
ncbi:forkhead-associated domain-containing protein 1-like [Mytilus trossulus]|uniref:forkhead-associated domain-containing protein 1-like n=1 Tax=Mytilus trossulus TaxID=6551 RepID=UPI003005625D